MKQMARSFDDVHAAYWFLAEHAVRGYLDTSFAAVLEVVAMRVDPITRRVEDDPTRNTHVEIWLESGPGLTEPGSPGGSVPWHDVDLDSSGDTFETALIRLAQRVSAKYGDGQRQQ